MIPSLLPFLILLGLPLGEAVPPPKVAEIRFEDLVRFSDVIVVGTVERVETINWQAWKMSEAVEGGFLPPPLPPKVPFAEVVVSQVLKGAPEVRRLAFLAVGTWTCDITSAKVGERALFFLAEAERDELFDDQLRLDISTRFPETPLMRVLWSGRGKMQLRTLPDGEYATYWADDVLLPEDFPHVEGPEPQYGFIRSASLAAFAREIESCIAAQKEPWLKATVTDTMDGSIAWELDVAWDRQARLVVHDLAGDRVERFLLDSSEAVRVASGLEGAKYQGYPKVLGKGRPNRGVRILEVFDPKEPMLIRIFTPDEDCMRSGGASLVLDTWKTLRGSFDKPACANHRQEDEPWLER